MSEWSLPREGGCRCGEVRFKVSAPPLLTALALLKAYAAHAQRPAAPS